MILLVVIYLILQVAIIRMNQTRWQVFNGVFMSFQYGVALLMILCAKKRGSILGLVLMGIGALSTMRAAIMGHTLTPLPGLFNAVFYMITLAILGHFYQKREREAVTDVLTGLMNRRGLNRLLRSKVEDETPFRLFYICLDNFKAINDSYGHAYGDELMRNLSARVVERIGERGVVARMGGAEFVIVMNEKDVSLEDANAMLDEIREKTTLESEGARLECYMTCFAGVSSFPKDSRKPEDLIKYADLAMAKAVALKQKNVRVFTQELADGVNSQLEIEAIVKDGLENDDFFLVYQPQYHIGGKTLRGFESLIRINPLDGRRLSPAQFIPIAEMSDLILQVDDYVIRRVLQEFKPIIEERPELIVSVNVSSRNISSKDFVERIQDFLNETVFPPKNLEIEITEYCLVDSMESTIENIKRLREIGVQVALDDFGTGYTSLNYLSKMPINLLKIDKSLIDDIETDKKRSDFVRAVVSMGHLMGCEVISEGVENERQLEVLLDKGCDFVQGYVWGHPMAYQAAKALAFGK